MKITELPAYIRINRHFKDGTFKKGTKSVLPIYVYERENDKNLTPGHFVYAINYCNMQFKDVPKEFLTRDFFIHTLSADKKDILDYVKSHIGKKFNRKFFRDYITTNPSSLESEDNCFAYMPLNYIDTEMVSCAMLKTIDSRYVERRGDFDYWFYTVAKRRPQVLTQDFWTLGARCFATRKDGKNKFLDITPPQYKTEEYYFAMCLSNSTPVMEDFPESIQTTNFLVRLINDSALNIRSFSSKALEKTAPTSDGNRNKKFWQVAILLNGYVAQDIPLDDKRLQFVISNFGDKYIQYCYGFKDAYNSYLMSK